jgi:hypothetical protein
MGRNINHTIGAGSWSGIKVRQSDRGLIVNNFSRFAGSVLAQHPGMTVQGIS